MSILSSWMAESTPASGESWPRFPEGWYLECWARPISTYAKPHLVQRQWFPLDLAYPTRLADLTISPALVAALQAAWDAEQASGAQVGERPDYWHAGFEARADDELRTWKVVATYERPDA